jgi:hypothetical protein
MVDNLLELKIGFLERLVEDLERQVGSLRDDNATLLKRAFTAECRIKDHYDMKDNPDEVDRRLWGDR